MNVTVKYVAQAREATGTSSEVFAFEDPLTVRDLVIRLARQHGAAFRNLALDANGAPHPSLLVILGDEQIRADERRLQGGETLTILAPISGG